MNWTLIFIPEADRDMTRLDLSQAKIVAKGDASEILKDIEENL